MKNVYSVVLSSDVVEAVDRLAYENGTNRSGMINRILADYVSYQTPEMRFLEIFRHMQEVLADTQMIAAAPSETMLSLRSALAYKYNPTVRYSVELFRGEREELGELRVSLRTQNRELILCMMQFYHLWSEIEKRYRKGIVFAAENGKYARRLIPEKGRTGIADLGQAIADYINTFDKALKYYFRTLNAPSLAAVGIDELYRAYLEQTDAAV